MALAPLIICSFSLLRWSKGQNYGTRPWHTDDSLVARGEGKGMAIFCIRDMGAQAHTEFKRSPRTNAQTFEYGQGQGYLVLDEWFSPGQHRFKCGAGRIIVRVGFCTKAC